MIYRMDALGKNLAGDEFHYWYDNGWTTARPKKSADEGTKETNHHLDGRNCTKGVKCEERVQKRNIVSHRSNPNLWIG